jgi:DNA processing protein
MPPGIGAITLARLLAVFETPSGVLSAAANGDLRHHGLRRPNIEFLTAPDLVLIEKDLEWMDAGDDRHILSRDSHYYPDMLKGISDPPPVLYVQGNITLLR